MDSKFRIKVINEDIRLRPSSIDTFFQCPYQWGKVFLEGISTIPSARAAVGTAIHRAAEVMWLEAMQSQKIEPNLSMMTDAAVEAWKEETQKGVSYDEDDNENVCLKEIVAGSNIYAEDIAPFAQIPYAVEEFLSVPIKHPLVKEVGGTIDYRAKNTIADIKTSKKKPTASNYRTQQSIYKYLANANGKDVSVNLIHGIVLKQKPEGTIIPADINVEQAKSLVNMVLDTLEIVSKDIMPVEVLLRPNPKYYLCSPKYCSLYGKNCPATCGVDIPAAVNV